MSARPARRTARAATVAVAATGVAGLVLSGPAGAASASAASSVVDRETVQARLDADGEVASARLYEQLTVVGDGRVEVVDPTSEEGVRDLDGFDAPSTRDGAARHVLDVQGRAERRTVAEHTGDLPVTLTPRYVLDGEPVEPEDVVGRSGRLEVTYTVVNTTAEPTEITYTGGRGTDVTETVDLVVPYVGTLQSVLPTGFSAVTADGASVVGDGRGATTVSWSLVLFNPLGEPAQQLEWAADVEDAVLPPAELTVVPVAPGGNELIANGERTISEGATGLTTLTGGVVKVDGKLGELQAGAAKLLAGLDQLSAGAEALNEGLAGTAAPGAAQLADGLEQAQAGGGALATGLGTLAAGAGTLSSGLATAKTGSGTLAAGLGAAAAGSTKLAAGSGELATGAEKAAAGATALDAGLQQISAGLDQLAAASALPAARDGAVQLRAGVDRLLAGLGSPTAEGTLLNGVAKLSAGLTAVGGGVGQVSTGLAGAQQSVAASANVLGPKVATGGPLDQLVAGAQGLATNLGALCDAAVPAAAGGGFAAAFDAACKPRAATATTPASPGLRVGSATVAGGVVDVRASSKESYEGLLALDTGLQRALGGLAQVGTGVAQLQTGTGALGAGLAQVSAGLRSGDTAKPGLAEGLDGLVAGLTSAVEGVSQLSTGARTASAGSSALADGNAALAAGAGQLAAGGQDLDSGLAQLAAGGAKLDGGLAQLADGGSRLAAGAGAASQGSTELASGLTQLADGSGRLAAGLGDAADGSGRIADGLVTVRDGVGAVEDGTVRLQGEGTGLIASSADAAATLNAKNAAMLRAVAARAEDGALPYGAPDGATGSAVWELQLAGADTSTRDSTTRGVLAIALLGLGSLAGFALRRRSI